MFCCFHVLTAAFQSFIGFLPILEKLLPRIQKLAELAQNNSDVIVKLILVIGSLAASVLTINGIMRVYAATLAIVDLTTKALDASNYGLNLSYASLGSRLGLFTAVVASLGITIQGLGMDGGAVFKDLSGRVAQFINLGIAGWTATQGNRSSISSEVVTTDQMGGSIKKAQVGHVIISVAKTLQQKELKLATIAITKSRIGKDGVIFENCKFDNELLVIDTESSMTMLGFEENKEQKNRDRIREILDRKKQQAV